MKRARAAQPSIFDALAPIVKQADKPTSAKEGPPFGPMPRKPGDMFLCSGCQKTVAATKDGRVMFVQLGNDPTSIRVVWLACSKRCANKANWCGSCEVFGHAREDGPDVCPRWHAGRRMRALKLYRCYAHDLVAEYRSGSAFSAITKTVGQLLDKHGGDFAKVRADVEAFHDNDRYLLVVERAERDDPWWGAEVREETPESVADNAKYLVDSHRALLVRQRGESHHWSLERSTPVLLDVTEKMGRRAHAATAYGSRATTEDAVRVLVPFLQHDDSSMRSCAAWGLFTHRTPEVRAALLAQAEVENVPRLKAILEELARSE